HASPHDRVLDLTDWSLYFSQHPGYAFARVYDAPVDPAVRWIVVREPHVVGHWHYSMVIRDLIGGHEPVALVPPRPHPHHVQVRIYDRLAHPGERTALAPAAVDGREPRRR